MREDAEKESQTQEKKLSSLAAVLRLINKKSEKCLPLHQSHIGTAGQTMSQSGTVPAGAGRERVSISDQQTSEGTGDELVQVFVPLSLIRSLTPNTRHTHNNR